HAEREIAHGIVDMRELPVEHADEAIAADDDIADPEVAVVHDGRTRGWAILPQPPQAELDRRMRLAHLVELGDHPLDRRLWKERQPLRRNRMDLRELVRELGRKALARRRELVL